MEDEKENIPLQCPRWQEYFRVEGFWWGSQPVLAGWKYAEQPLHHHAGDVYYNYYRLGMDKLYEDENAARVEVMNVLNLLNNFNTDNPNKMINQFFFQANLLNW